MKEKDKEVLGYAIIVVVLIVGFMFLWGIRSQEVYLCRRVFSGLVKGSYRVQKFIDWEGLKAVGVDVGATYLQLPNEKEKSDYKKAFIKNFSVGFKRAGGKLSAFTNWRIYERDSEKTVVAADYLAHNKTILFTISKYGRRKLTTIQWEESR